MSNTGDSASAAETLCPGCHPYDSPGRHLMLPWYLFQKLDWLYVPAKSICSEDRNFLRERRCPTRRPSGNTLVEVLYGDRSREDPDISPPPRVTKRGVSSTPPHAHRHPLPCIPHTDPVRTLTMPAPMLPSGRYTRRGGYEASAVAVWYPSVVDVSCVPCATMSQRDRRAKETGRDA